MWIQECRKLYEKRASEVSGKQTTPRLLEEALAEARARLQVGPEELKIIEQSPHWPYPNWWPRLSNEFGDPIELPGDMGSPLGKRQAVEELQERLKHIEVVSILLRFLVPEEFGIISPPVTGLLNLVPEQHYVNDYLRYLSTLDKLRQRYGVFKRIADFDMALWTAAHLPWTGRDAILDEMNQDNDFQQIRLENLVEGLGRHWMRTERARLNLAEAMWKHDHVLAAVMAARCIESIVGKVADKYGIHISAPKPGGSLFGPRIWEIKNSSYILEKLQVSSDQLENCRIWRNQAVHGEPEITKGESQKFIQEIQRLLRLLP